MVRYSYLQDSYREGLLYCTVLIIVATFLIPYSSAAVKDSSELIPVVLLFSSYQAILANMTQVSNEDMRSTQGFFYDAALLSPRPPGHVATPFVTLFILSSISKDLGINS